MTKFDPKDHQNDKSDNGNYVFSELTLQIQ